MRIPWSGPCRKEQTERDAGNGEGVGEEECFGVSDGETDQQEAENGCADAAYGEAEGEEAEEKERGCGASNGRVAQVNRRATGTAAASQEDPNSAVECCRWRESECRSGGSASLGARWIGRAAGARCHTLRKLPNASPKSTAKIAVRVCTSAQYTCDGGVGQETDRVGLGVGCWLIG